MSRDAIPELVHDFVIVFTAKTEDVTHDFDTCQIDGPLFIKTGLGVPVSIHSASVLIDAQCNVRGEASVLVLKLGETNIFRRLDDSRFPVDLRIGDTLKGDDWLATDTSVFKDQGICGSL